MQAQYDKDRIEQLVDEVKNGHTDSFSQVYDHFFPKIYKYVFYKARNADVDDLVATVFIKAWSKINTYKKTDCSFSSWLFRIAHNTVIDYYRTHKSVVELEDYIPDKNERMSPSFLSNQQFDSERVHRALRQLDDKYQQVVILKFMQDLPNKEIASVMGVQETSVRTLQFRALKQLRGVLEDEDMKIKRRMEPEIKKEKKSGFFSVERWLA
jgi:RNA polymerase sigma-70 factor, ECF subfamily